MFIFDEDERRSGFGDMRTEGEGKMGGPLSLIGSIYLGVIVLNFLSNKYAINVKHLKNYV